jgi:hypothetical protein
MWEDGKFVREFEHHFLDFVVDGRSLRDLAVGDETVTPLSRPWLEDVGDEVDRLMGRRPTDGLEPGRSMLLVCRVDGHRDCGALTAQISVTDVQVTWSDWRWESFRRPEPIDALTAPLTFDRQQYEEALSLAPKRVASMPYDVLAHRGKHFLWPWQWGWRVPPDAN